MTFAARRKHGSMLDDGLTVTTLSQHQTERALRFANGSGDDVADAVAESLGLDLEEGSEESGFGDPLDLLIASEEDD